MKKLAKATIPLDKCFISQEFLESISLSNQEKVTGDYETESLRARDLPTNSEDIKQSTVIASAAIENGNEIPLPSNELPKHS